MLENARKCNLVYGDRKPSLAALAWGSAWKGGLSSKGHGEGTVGCRYAHNFYRDGGFHRYMSMWNLENCTL